MVATPKVIGPDGVARELTIFSTTIPNRFFRGTMDSSTVDMEISIRGSAFTSDPDLIVFEEDTFFIPNTTAFPEGLELAAGLNVLEIRSISFSGSVSTSARVEVTLVQEADIGLVGQAPTNLSVEQLNDSVQVRAEGVDDTRFRGLNFYASRFQGGGASGYQRININIVADAAIVQETETIGSFEANSTVATNPDGTPAADPLYVKIAETQTSSDEILQNLEDVTLTPELAAAITEENQATLLKTDFVEVFEVPETTTDIRTTVSIDSVVSRDFYSFFHNRQFGPANTPATVAVGEFANLAATEPLYYVTTAIYFDPETLLEVESAFSVEVSAQPIIIVQNIGTFPAPSRLQIAQDTVVSLSRTTPQLAVAPGNVIRDTFVDPFSNEAQRLRFLVDFLYRIQGFDTLLAVDGIQADGTSTPVDRSPYKQALARVFDLSNPLDVQTIIDTAFEQLASRDNVFRKAGTKSRGFATFFTRQRPTATIFIPLGSIIASGGIQFITTSDASIPIANLASFFNPSSGIFEIDIPIQAAAAGKSGDLGSGQIRQIVTNLGGLSVTNRNRTFGGQDQETNLQLSTRARGALAAVDSGTERGTLQTAADVAGVLEVSVVSAGDALMQRDFDEDFDKHVGGKVDVWIRGESVGTVTDNFSFTFEVAQDVQFVVIGNPNDLVFRALDVRLSTENPIAEMLDDPELGLGLRNATTGAFYDLTDVVIQDYRTVQLDNSVNQPSLAAFGDVVLGDYRYITSTKFVMTRQPVDSISSVTGTISGILSEAQYELIRPEDPLLDGRSVKAGDYLNIIQVDGIPSGESIEVDGEQHILIGEFDEFMNSLGVNPLTVVVTNQEGTIEFRGPFDPSGISDYTITPGTQTTALSIERTENSAIVSGDTVLVSYDHAENFVVEYDTNFVIQTTQDTLDLTKHLTADVLAKEMVPAPMDITATILVQQGSTVSTVDRAIRTNLATFLRALTAGSAVRQSDLITVMDRTVGVSFVETPLRKIARSAGARVIHEGLDTADGEDVTLLLGSDTVPYSTDTVRTWLIEDELNSATSTGGGDDTNFRGVFQDDAEMALRVVDPQKLKDEAGQAFIIGQEGLVIPNFSDDTTIENNFPSVNTAQEIEAIRRQLTGNRVLVSLPVNDRPTLHTYTVTYTVAFVESGANDLEASALEFFEVGNFIFTFGEDTRG